MSSNKIPFMIFVKEAGPYLKYNLELLEKTCQCLLDVTKEVPTRPWHKIIKSLNDYIGQEGKDIYNKCFEYIEDGDIDIDNRCMDQIVYYITEIIELTGKLLSSVNKMYVDMHRRYILDDYDYKKNDEKNEFKGINSTLEDVKFPCYELDCLIDELMIGNEKSTK